MATISATGITIKTLQQWKAELEAIYATVDPEWDVSTNTPDGQILAALAEMLANADEGNLDSYNAADPAKALDEALDAIMRISNTARVEGTYSAGIVQLSGIVSTVVPAGTKIENSVTGTKWATDTEVTLGASATDAAVTCVTIGSQSAAIGELTKIATPVTGLQSVDNSAAATLGRNEMTNAEARLYREETISNRATNNIDAIYSAVAGVSGVTSVRTVNNRTGSTDANSVPANSFAVIVDGGANADIAEAIYNRLTPGPGMYGGGSSVTVNHVSPDTGNDEDIVFGRPTAVPLYVEVTLVETGSFPSTIAALVKQALVDFSIGDLFDDDTTTGNRKDGFKIGESISSGMLHTPVNYIVGALGQGYVDTIFIDDSASPSAAGTVAITWQQLATMDAADIEVTVI